MIKNTLIIVLVIVIIYLYYQQQKIQTFPASDSGGYQRTLFSFEEEQLKENLAQALALQAANKTKMAEQAQEINNLKNRLNIYEGVGGSASGETEKLKAVLNE